MVNQQQLFNSSLKNSRRKRKEHVDLQLTHTERERERDRGISKQTNKHTVLEPKKNSKDNMIAFINLSCSIFFGLGVEVAERGVAGGFAPGVRDLGLGLGILKLVEVW